MPRPTTTVPEVTTNSLVASGSRVTPMTGRSNYSTKQNWQQQVWGFFDTVGELQYAAGWFGACMSRTTIHAATRIGREYDIQESGPAVDILDQFFGGGEGQSQAMGQIGIHIFLVGECYAVGRKARRDRGERFDYQWEVVGINEMTKVGEQWAIDYGDGSLPLVLNDNEDIIRLWMPHPKKRLLANSPVRSCLTPLAEIEACNQRIRSQLISRLKNDVLLLPQGLTFPTPTDGSVPEDATEADKVMQVLFDAMNTAILHPGEASAQTPIVMMVPDQFVDKANLLKLWSDLDEKIIEMRSDAIKRLGLGLNIPVEILTGASDMNHWGMWQVDESSIKSHIEPVDQAICSALTENLIIPQTGNPNDAVRFDTSALRMRPNRSKEAIELFDRGQLRAETLLRETGFTAEDAPDEEEQKRWLLMKIASGSATPEQVQAALTALGVELMVAEPLDSQTPREARPDPSLQEHPTRDLPEPEAAAMDIGLIAACDVLVYRALERAGNRMRSLRGVRPDGIAAADMHLTYPARPSELDRFMEDAWSCIPRTLKGIPFDQQKAVEAALDDYVRELLRAGTEHDTEQMKHYLHHSVVRTLV